MKMNWKQEMAALVSDIIRYPLHEEAIRSDFPGQRPYLQDLLDNHPVLLMCIDSQLGLFLSQADYARLDKGELSVEHYVNTAQFSAGFLWGKAGGGDILSGSFWGPLQGTGLHDSDAAHLSLFFRTQACAARYYSGSCPSKYCTTKCTGYSSMCPASYTDGIIRMEDGARELDRRFDLFKALHRRIKTELGFSVCLLDVHTVPMMFRNQVAIVPFPHDRDRVGVLVSSQVLNHLLYAPTDEVFREEMASLTELVAQYPIPHQKRQLILDMKDKHERRQACLAFWASCTDWAAGPSCATSDNAADVKQLRTSVSLLAKAFGLFSREPK